MTDLQNSQKPLNRDQIKLFAMFTMLLNHIAHAFLRPGSLCSEIFLDLGYFTAVTMCYFLVDGYGYTRSKGRYALRLGLFALLSQLPYNLLFGGSINSFVCFNMMATLLLCFLLLLVQDQVKNPALRSLLSVSLVFLTGFCDWPWMAAIFTLLFYKAKGSPAQTKIVFIQAMLIFFMFQLMSRGTSLGAGALLLSLCSTLGIALSGVVICTLYNGQRASRGRTFYKWFFYLFYPLHLLVLAFLRDGLL